MDGAQNGWPFAKKLCVLRGHVAQIPYLGCVPLGSAPRQMNLDSSIPSGSAMVRACGSSSASAASGERATMLLEIRSRLGLIPLVLHYNASMYVCTPPSSPPRYRRRSQLTMRLSDAGLRQRPTKLIYTDHRPSPWLTEDASPALAPTDC